jgi:hypothetical protein
MKAFAALILASMIVSVSIIASPALATYEPSVGVKEGDWIEYEISVTGKGAMPPTHDVRWFRIEVLPPIEGAAFSVNLTSRYANGTVGSAIWKFNFTEGNVGGWIIIPSNLSPGDEFYDSWTFFDTRKQVNVTIEGEEQKTLLGASRTVTYGNDWLRHKEWDKATGVFVATVEVYKNVTNRAGWYIEDLTLNVTATATNMWSPQILGLDQTTFYTIVIVVVVAVVIVALAIAVVMRKKKFSKR